MKAGVIIFPGSNCDRDMYNALSKYCKNVEYIWHKDPIISNDFDIIAIPGGFSYGDYLRCGAIAAKSALLSEIANFAAKGKYILGVCNGFQILTEANLLPGTLIKNNNLKFINKIIEIKLANKTSIFTNKFTKDIVKIPIAHHDGNYFCTDEELTQLKKNDQIAFKYTNDVNGSIDNIAGILNKDKNILGMMPHPERAVDKKLETGTDGIELFLSLISQ